MTVIHKLPSRPPITSEYDMKTHTLTRVIDSTIHTIHLKHRTTIEDLERLSSLDDESFALMAYLQKEK